MKLNYQVHTLKDRPEFSTALKKLNRETWPDFIIYGDTSRWDRIYTLKKSNQHWRGKKLPYIQTGVSTFFPVGNRSFSTHPIRQPFPYKEVPIALMNTISSEKAEGKMKED